MPLFKKVKMTVFVIFITLSAIFLYTNIKSLPETKKSNFKNTSNTSTFTLNTSSPSNSSVTPSMSVATSNPDYNNYESPINFKKYKNINSDTIAWVKIPNTNINYPIVQTNDNEKYLYVNFEGKKSAEGTIYLDYESNSDFSGWNNLFYGHNMKNGTMFKDIVKFKNKDFFNKNRIVYIYTPKRTIELITIAAFYDTANNITRKTDFKNQTELYTFVKNRISECSFAKFPDFNFKQIYIFVTCSYEFDNARTFLYAVENN